MQQIIQDRFGNHTQIRTNTYKEGLYVGQTVTQIVCRNQWYDVWTHNDEIVRVVEVHEYSMSPEELQLYKEVVK